METNLKTKRTLTVMIAFGALQSTSSLASPVAMQEGVDAAAQAPTTVRGAIISGQEVEMQTQAPQNRTPEQVEANFTSQDRWSRIEQLRTAYVSLRNSDRDLAEQFRSDFIIAGNNYRRVSRSLQASSAPSGKIKASLGSDIDRMTRSGSQIEQRLSHHLSRELREQYEFEQRGLSVLEFDLDLNQRLIGALQSGAFSGEMSLEQVTRLIATLQREIVRSKQLKTTFNRELSEIQQILSSREDDQTPNSTEGLVRLGQTQDAPIVAALPDSDVLRRVRFMGGAAELNQVHSRAHRSQ